MKIDWAFVKQQLGAAYSNANMVLATREQAENAYRAALALQQAEADRIARESGARTQQAQADALAAERQRAADLLALQQAQIESARRAAELQLAISQQTADGAADGAARQRPAAQAEWDAYQAQSAAASAPSPMSVNVSVVGGGGGGGTGSEGFPEAATSLPADLPSGEPPISKIILYGLLGLAAFKLLKG
jgi:hypothetical protein